MVKDIVCGMGIEEDDPGTCSRSLAGRIFYFCSPECMLLFTKDPSDYINLERKGKNMSRDPVCGMDVDENNAPFTTTHKGKTIYFCCQTCKREFEQEPEKFIKKMSKASKSNQS